MKNKVLAVILIFLIGIQTGFGEDESKVENTYRLNINEISRLALENNFDIQLAKYDTWIAKTDEISVQSLFDTIFSGEVRYQNNQRKQSSTIIGTKVFNNNYNIGLSKKIPTGTTFEVDLTNNRNWTDSAFTTSPLVHDSTLGLTITQELGKNFFGLRDRGEVMLTKVDVENTEYTSLKRIEDNVADIQKAYWDLVLQNERVTIEEDMVEQARRLYDLHQEKLKHGVVEIPEAIASEANYKKRQNELILAQNIVHRRINVLKLLLNISDYDIFIEPQDILLLNLSQQAFEESLKMAFGNRWDYRRAKNEITEKDIELSMKKNSLWPEINLSASLERNGLGDHFKQAVTQITDEDNPNFIAALTITMPLENREARGEFKKAELMKAKSLINLKLIERTIAIEIINQVRDVNVFHELALNQDVITSLQVEKLEKELKRFNLGRSDTDTLIRFQEDVIQARLLLAEAKYRNQIALVDLEQKKGTLLNRYWEGEL